MERGVLEVEALERAHDDVRDALAHEGLVVGGDGVPGSPGSRGLVERVFIRAHVLGPVAALLDVSEGELPVARRVFDPLHEARLLLVARDVEPELQDDGAVSREVPLVLTDRLVAVLEQPVEVSVVHVGQALVAQIRGVDAHDQDLLVVRAVEDADASSLGESPGGAPQEVMVELLGARLLEGEDLAAGGVDAGHDGANGPILACGVHRLEDEEQRVAVVGVEPALEVVEFVDAVLEGARISALVGLAARRERGHVFDAERPIERDEVLGLGRFEHLASGA